MASLEDIVHIEKPLKGGGKVLILNTGAVIDPEAQAMLGALHSRSIGGIQSHLKILGEKGPENFMSKFYVGYGHKSIGDLGSVSVFIEGISMLAAKAIQDLRLYNGQESSTRYIDFTKQPFVDPVGSSDSEKILESLRAFYLYGLERLPHFLKEKYPMEENEKEGLYEKAILARAFDIMRSFLPAGASTNIVWHGPLRVIGDRLNILRHHPLEEIRNVAEALEKALIEAHPSSFSNKRYEGTEKYLSETVSEMSYLDLDNCPDFSLTHNALDREFLLKHSKFFEVRPAKTELPRFFDESGEMQFLYLLDFGSFRDIQRHRAVIQRMPLLTTRYGFENWYLEEMPESLREEARRFLAEYEKNLSLDISKESLQYFIPMGYRTANRLSGNLPALVYLVELRSGSTVHPTLRILAQRMGQAILKGMEGIPFTLHLDMTPNRFDIKRGSHDIVLK